MGKWCSSPGWVISARAAMSRSEAPWNPVSPNCTIAAWMIASRRALPFAYPPRAPRGAGVVMRLTVARRPCSTDPLTPERVIFPTPLWDEYR